MAKPKKRKFVCSVCGKKFGCSGHLTRHMVVHTSERLIQCIEPTCDKTFSRKDNMLRHAASHTPPEECQFLCEHENCRKRFPTAEKLRRHVKIHNPENFPLECPQCDMRFLKKNLRALHLHEVHKVPKMFPCEVDGCNQAFMRVGDRNRHVRKKHTVKQLFCMHDDCVEVPPFSSIKLLNDHAREAHTRTECPDCGKKFSTPSSLRMHEKVHAIPVLDRYIFSCEYANCNARYTKQSNLDMHIRVKHKKLTYDCSICDTGLTTRSGLRRHYILMHGMAEERAAKLSDRTGSKRRRRLSEESGHDELDALVITETNQQSELSTEKVQKKLKKSKSPRRKKLSSNSQAESKSRDDEAERTEEESVQRGLRKPVASTVDEGEARANCGTTITNFGNSGSEASIHNDNGMEVTQNAAPEHDPSTFLPDLKGISAFSTKPAILEDGVLHRSSLVDNSGMEVENPASPLRTNDEENLLRTLRLQSRHLRPPNLFPEFSSAHSENSSCAEEVSRAAPAGLPRQPVS